MSVRVALLADTHGFLDPRVATAVQGCDYAVHAGDVGAAAVLQALRPGRGLIAVRGNNDVPAKWPAGQAGTLHGLPEQAELELPGGRLVAVHGDRAPSARGRHQWLRRQYTGVRAVVYGHSHRQVCDTSEEPWVLNPGAAGRARTYAGPGFLLLLAGPRRWRVEARRLEPLQPARRRNS